jgi:hypothetical protein
MYMTSAKEPIMSIFCSLNKENTTICAILRYIYILKNNGSLVSRVNSGKHICLEMVV